MWPSFNAATADAQFQTVAGAFGLLLHTERRNKKPLGEGRELSLIRYAVVNTFLSLTGSTVATFIVSRFVSHMKFEAVRI